MTIVHKSHGEFMDHLTGLLRNHRTPFSGTFELTPRCNLACAHCYLQGHRDDGAPLSLVAIRRILDELAGAGCLAIAFTGGEPLLRDDYFDIHRCAHERGFFISLFTNGVLLDEKVADRLAACPPRAVEISLYGGDEETYRTVTGCRGCFEKVAAAVELLQARGIAVILKSVLLAPIVDRIEPLLAFAADHHLNPVFDPAVTPTVDGDSAPVRLRDNPERAVDIEFAAPGSAERLRQFHDRIMASPPDDGDPLCGAGFYGFHIDFRGSLMKCLMLRSPSHSLLDMSFGQAWARLGETERPVFSEGTECRRCDHKHLCACCPGALYCGEAPPEGTDSFYCRVAAARMKKIRSGEGERSPK